MKSLLSLLVVICLVNVSYAQCPVCGGGHYVARWIKNKPTQQYRQAVQVANTFGQQEVYDALDEVNETRRRSGLRPFIRDSRLTQGAYECAKFRARRHMSGHTSNDFQFLHGAFASAGGCGAMEDSWGWGTCCTFENYTYAGAAWVRGSDGKRYMQLFVR